MSRLQKRLLPPLLILCAIAGCAAGSIGPRTRATDSYCLIASPLRYDSAADSAVTVREIEQHNSTWVCLCEQDCPKLKD